MQALSDQIVQYLVQGTSRSDRGEDFRRIVRDASNQVKTRCVCEKGGFYCLLVSKAASNLFDKVARFVKKSHNICSRYEVCFSKNNLNARNICFTMCLSSNADNVKKNVLFFEKSNNLFAATKKVLEGDKAWTTPI